MRTPLSYVEEFWQMRDPPDETANIQLEIRVSGPLDESRLREAVGAAVAAHPMARARQVTRRWLLRPPLWEIGRPEVGAIVRTIRCAEASEMEGVRDDFYSGTIGLEEAPALRILLAHRPRGDSLLLNVHHAIMDGVGALRLLHSIARAYAGRPDPVPPIDPLAARDFRSHVRRGTTPPRSRRANRPSRPTGPRAFIAPEGASRGSGYGFHHEVLSAEATRRLNPRRLEPAATVNDLLISALSLTIARWNAGRDRPCECIAVFMPINARPPDWRSEVVGNVTLGSKVTTTPGQRATDAALMAAVTAQTRWIKTGNDFAFLLDSPPWFLNLFPIWLPVLCRLLGDRVENTAVLSNLGRLEDVPDFGPSAGDVAEFWFSPPCAMPVGLTLGAATLHGCLHLVLRHCRALFDKGAARRFSSSLLQSLEDLGRGPHEAGSVVGSVPGRGGVARRR